MVKLFVVEDHPVFRSTLITLLDREPDFQVCGQAASGEEALEQLTVTHPDLLLVDISMPGMNGFTFVQEVQKRWPQLPCVFLSGHTQSIYREQARRSRAIAYLDKAKVRKLVPKLRQVLSEAARGGQAHD